MKDWSTVNGIHLRDGSLSFRNCGVEGLDMRLAFWLLMCCCVGVCGRAWVRGLSMSVNVAASLVDDVVPVAWAWDLRWRQGE